MQQRRLGPLYLLVVFTAFTLMQIAIAAEAETEDTASSEAATGTTVQSQVGEQNQEEEEDSTTEEIQSNPVTLNGEAQKLETTSIKVQEENDVTLGTTAPPVGEYFVLNRDMNSCIQLQVDSSITFTYKTKAGETVEAYEMVPTNIPADGDCSDEDASNLVLRWKDYVMVWNFAKTPGRERWYLNGMQLTVDTTSSKFSNIKRPGVKKLVTPKEHSMFFPTPVGKSYSCQEETSVELQDGDISAQVFLRSFKLQPFMYKKDFGPVYECSPGGGRAFRDETAPIAVGSTLAIVVLLTVTGYGVYRYFKIKKVQYDTME